MFKFNKFALICSGLLGSLNATATPFDGCPSNAYLMQGGSATLFGVNLATGSYSTLSDNLGTSGKINAVGFNVHDNFIYGYAYEWSTLARIHSDYSAEPLAVTNAPGASFYVGDVALAENKYFAYRPGSQYGLYSVDLDETSQDYLVFNRIVSGSALNLAIYDFAFHPENQQLYSVDRGGRLIVISPLDGTYEIISNVGESGTFGAVYFDSDAYLYISRNSDGHIYRINLSDQSPSAEFFAFGPSSSNNDGARCATASIIDDQSSVDFGSAPRTYGTTIEENGARHEQVEGMQLGDAWGAGNDGVEFVTNIESGMSSVVVTKVEGQGYLNAWGDWDKNGQFEDSEQVIVDQVVESGENLSLIEPPAAAEAGTTWARVRFSSQPSLGPNGGVSDGEVEDYEIEVLEQGSSVTHYPGPSSYVTVAFEDNWPQTGDYDMNDVVVAMRTSKFSNDNNQTTRYQVSGKVLALGAGYHNGFAIQLDGIPTSEIDANLTSLFVNGVKTEFSPLELNAPEDDAVLIISSDLKSRLPAMPSCEYYRTRRNCDNYESLDEFNFTLVVTLANGVADESSPSNILNPFIFPTPGIYHGSDFASPPGRALEIHLKDKKVSARFDTSFFGLADDRSSVENTFVTSTGMPWALEIPGLWSHPIEKQDLLKAYPRFKEFVESNALSSGAWYTAENRNAQYVIENLMEHINE